MIALEEAYLEIFGKPIPKDIDITYLAELMIEGLSAKIHGRVLIARCREEIANSPLIPAETKVWAKETFLIELA
jgi:hypothetical protein